MTITIKKQKESIFIEALRLYNHILVKNHLNEQEIKVLGCFMYLDSVYRDLPKEERKLIIFHRDYRKKVIEATNLKISNFNNVLSSLRKKNYLSKDNDILINIPIENDKIIFNFVIVKNDNTEKQN